MASRARRWIAMGSGALAGLVLLAGCQGEDPRLAGLREGMPRDSAMLAMGTSPPENLQSYLVEGRLVEGMFYRRPDTEGPFASLSRRDLTPMVIVDGALGGWTWSYWDSLVAANQIQHTNAPER